MKRQEMIQALQRGEDPLELSIQKWQDIIDRIGRNIGFMNCALCERYNINNDCSGCPIKQDTGKNFCRGTPYYTYIKNETREDAQKMLNYLTSLRPKPQETQTWIIIPFVTTRGVHKIAKEIHPWGTMVIEIPDKEAENLAEKYQVYEDCKKW